MSILQAIVLGIVQGLTEFLPVSSSGHLALAQALMRDESVGKIDITFDLALHVATLLAVLIYFRRKLFRLSAAVFDKTKTAERKLIFYLFLATLPIVAAGFTLKDPLENVKHHPVAVSALLCVTGLILFLPGWLKSRAENDHSVRSSLVMGVAQAFALLPGISRSGSTITAGLAVFSLEAPVSDRAEPEEVLRATTVWSSGLDGASVTLDAGRVDRFRRGDVDTVLSMLPVAHEHHPSWVWVERADSGAPYLEMVGRAAELSAEAGVVRWHLSLTHSDLVAVAYVVAE